MSPPRGRPRKFEHGPVLLRALEVFWRQGYAATTIDNLATAMGLNKPSLYNAYGDKQRIYRQALAAFVAQVRNEVGAALSSSTDIHEALKAFFDGALTVYCAHEPPLGCFVVCTATAEAVAHADIQQDLAEVIAGLDAMLAARFAEARDADQVPATPSPEMRARLTQAVLHSLAVRSRAGESRESLSAMATQAIAMVCGVV